jgi:hypothetical protein
MANSDTFKPGNDKGVGKFYANRFLAVVMDSGLLSFIQDFLETGNKKILRRGGIA